MWSLGVTMIELYDGQPPHYELEPMRAAMKIVSEAEPTFSSESAARASPAMMRILASLCIKPVAKRSSSADLAREPWVAGAATTAKNVVCGLIAEFQKQMKVSSNRSSVASVGQDATAVSTAAQRLARTSTGGGGRPRAPSMIMSDAAVRELAAAREDRAKRDRSFMQDGDRDDKLQRFLATFSETPATGGSGAARQGSAAAKLVESESRTRRSKSMSKPLHLKGSERSRSQSVSAHDVPLARASSGGSSGSGLSRIHEATGARTSTQRARVGSVSRRRSGSISSVTAGGSVGNSTPRSRKSRSDSRLSQISTPSPRR